MAFARFDGSQQPLNSAYAILVYDRSTFRTRGVTSAFMPNAYMPAGPVLSPDGGYLVFSDQERGPATNAILDPQAVVRWDLQTNKSERFDTLPGGRLAQNYSWTPSLSSGGRYLAFASRVAFASNDHNREWDAYLHDKQQGLAFRISVSASGQELAARSDYTVISADGKYATVRSDSEQLTGVGMGSGVANVFVLTGW